MGKQIKIRITKTIVALIAVFLLVALTVASASARDGKSGNYGGSNHNGNYGDKGGSYNKGDKGGNYGSDNHYSDYDHKFGSYNKGGYWQEVRQRPGSNRYGGSSCWRWWYGRWVWAC